MKNLFILFLVLPLFLHAQDTTKPACLKPWSVEVFGGVNSYSDIPLNNDEMRKVAPNSQLLQRDFSGYYPSHSFPYNSFTINTAPTISIMAEFVPYSKKKKSYQWYSTIRAGISYSELLVEGPYYWRNDRKNIDTLYPGNGTTIYDDSVSYRQYSFQWTGQCIGVDVNQMFHTDEKRVFSIGIGYGVHFGVAVNTVFHGVYSGYSYLETTTVTPPSTYNTVESSYVFTAETENIRTKSVFYGKIYFPIAVQIRFSRRPNFWNKLAFTAESRGSIDIQPIPGFGTMTRFYISQNFGLKYYFEYNATKEKKKK